ncbi:four-carbon acid sugar kinase family protein [Microbacterium sp.]|uniref:four-carbon acid sugar kinase family protein n=1 Tax=Microbacterium sp. TaxID=51671 RepID=UPI0039C94D48
MDERDALAEFPGAVSVEASSVRAAAIRLGTVLIVLDDDPTGTQSVADLPVLTKWDRADFDWALAQGASAVYVLTNTRSLDPAEAAERNRQIVTNASASAAMLGITLGFASRSDSTLRGHYPLETDVIAQTLADAAGERVDGVVIVPAFPDAGRVTIGGVHYMRDGDALTPIAETEFAKDATFGYASSSLSAWVEEKSSGRIRQQDVVVLDLGIIRSGATAIAEALAFVNDSTPIVADAVSEDDLRLLSLGLIESESRGKRFLYRVGPPFVRARIGQEIKAPLTTGEIFTDPTPTLTGGLIVVGSHVGLTTRQLARLKAERPDAVTVEVDVNEIVGTSNASEYLSIVSSDIVEALGTGDVIVNTSRTLKRSDDPAESLDISRRVSAALVTITQRALAARPPRFVVAKGGITSSDVASLGLSIRHAIVRGPMLPGIVSLWQPVDGPAVGIPYVVFAGNVGDDGSLAAVVATLSAHVPVRSPR